MKKNEMKRILVDDMFLTVDVHTTAGSRMLEGYQSPIPSVAVTRAEAAGYMLTMKAPVGEFAIDLFGKTSVSGAWVQNGVLKNATAQMFWSGDVMGALCLDVNGYPRRVAAQSSLVCLKPTWETVSRYGVISVAASGETVDILAWNAEDCRDLFNAVVDAPQQNTAPIRRVALLTSLDIDMNREVKRNIDIAIANLEKSGISTTYVENSVFCAAKAAWNVILCAEICKNLARYDGIRYGHRAKIFSNLDELYANSRTEGFGDLVKAAILYGSETLSAEKYEKVYDKALRVRRVIADEFEKLFQNFDAVLLPACSKMIYTEDEVKQDRFIAFEENRYTSLATLAGLPAVVAGGVQIVGKAFSEYALLDAANIINEEGR